MSHQPDNIFARTQVVSLVEIRGTNHSHGSAQPFWRKELCRDFERALAETRLLERPDYEAANRVLVKAPRAAANDSIPADMLP